MPDPIPASVLVAAEFAVNEAYTRRGWNKPSPWFVKEVARAALEAAGPMLTEPLRDHIDTDHGVMVHLGRIADAAVKMLEHIGMDTDEDRDLHARATGALRARLDEMAATMKEANEAAENVSPHSAPTGEDGGS